MPQTLLIFLMKISIVTVCFNSEVTIKDTIESVSNQNGVDKLVEHIIIDGQSKDDTLSIIQNFPHIVKVISESDNGIYDAMNKGIKMATGDIIGLLNSDDLYYDNYSLQKVVTAFESNPDTDVVFGDLVYVDKLDTNKIIRYWKSKSYYDRFFEDGFVPPHPSFFVRKEVYVQAGLYDIEFKLAADYEFMLRTMRQMNFKSVYIPEVLVRMRLGGATNQSIRNIVKGNIEIIKAWKKNELSIPLKIWAYRIARRTLQYLTSPDSQPSIKS